MIRKTPTLLAAAVLATGLAAPVARASDAPEPAPRPAAAAPAADRLATARKLVDARQWGPAMQELKRVDDRASADWNNLMGYVSRKGPTPDLAASERYYDAALRIDPQHRNTLEYSGELFLMKGDLPRAQARLAALASACASNCPQYAQLKDAIARYQANGNKYVAPGNGW
jgi:tetratricopeptide (TPR) repeat protein